MHKLILVALIAIVVAIIFYILLKPVIAIFGLIQFSLTLFLILILTLFSNYKRKSISFVFSILTFAIINFITLIIVSNVVDTLKKNKAEEIISILKAYKSEKGLYPPNLETIGFNDKKYELVYRKDSLKNEFEIWYIIDSWSAYVYTSEGNYWYTDD